MTATTPRVRAAQAVNRIEKLRQQCEQEIAAAPESIRDRYAQKEAKLIESLPEDVIPLVESMLGFD